MADEILVVVSCPEDKAQSIARPLVEEKLAACVSIIPAIKSLFVWQGKFCQEEESILFIKSSRSCWLKLERRVKELHSYQVPEIIAIPIETGYKPYLDWLHERLGMKLDD